jgi:hypothetical protein
MRQQATTEKTVKADQKRQQVSDRHLGNDDQFGKMMKNFLYIWLGVASITHEVEPIGEKDWDYLADCLIQKS